MVSTEQGKKSKPLTEQEVLSIASKESIIQDFIARNPGYKTKVTFLDKGALELLAKESPAIYADLPKEGLYKVEYMSEEEGVLLLLDPKSKEVLKYYRVKTLTF